MNLKEGLADRVRALMRRNLMEGYSALLDARYCYIAPSLERYQFQWFWDTCFHVFILCALGEMEIAKRNMESLFKMQTDDGFVGHMIFWHQTFPHRPSDVLQALPRWQSLRPHMSALIQPPLVAQAVKRIYEATGDRLFLYGMLPRLIQYHDWLARTRDFDGDGLISIISPFESGIDWKPSFDETVGYSKRITPRNLFMSGLYWDVLKIDAMNFLRRYNFPKKSAPSAFAVKEVTANTMYACDLRALSDLCALANMGERATAYKVRAEKVGAAILAYCYDVQSAAFYDARAGSNEKLKVLSAMSFLPLLLPEIPSDICSEMVGRHLINEQEFSCPYPIPSVAMNDLSFSAEETLALWRGPTWPVMNWFLYSCLRKRGFAALAKRLRESVTRLIEKSGFREYYNPLTGEGYGAKEFTWAGLIVDMEGY